MTTAGTQAPFAKEAHATETSQAIYKRAGPGGPATPASKKPWPGPAEYPQRPATVLCPHASAVAVAFFITLPTFFAFFIAAFIAPPFMAAFFMAPAFFIAAALFIAAMTRSWCNEAGFWKGIGLGALEP